MWETFQNRFRIPRILEFYAATEGEVSLFNVEGKRGAIGRIPSYLAHRFPAALIQFDVEKGEPVRDEQGFCIRCKTQRSRRSDRPDSERPVEYRRPIRRLHQPGGFRKENSPQRLRTGRRLVFEPAI